MAHTIIDPVWIPMPDGVRLAARIWMPKTEHSELLPAVLEFLPYRRRDGTAPRDESTYSVFADAGIVGVRVDQRGCGDSDGLVQDEYVEQELLDAESVIAWIIGQPWSNRKVGMMGISWGGFNALQVAYRQPPGLAAVISIGTTVDRYHDDIHYKGGAQLSANFSWATTMLCYSARPPEPGINDDWHQLWLNRLEHISFRLADWLNNPTRNAFWKHGSVSENYSNMIVPSLVISGWADGYGNAPPAAVANFPGTCKAINGPWIHKYPHIAWPKPRMDFHAEAISWWLHWLNGEDKQREALPPYRAYIGVATRPGPYRQQENGYWVAVDWPSEPEYAVYCFASAGELLDKNNQNAAKAVNDIRIHTAQDTGVHSGEFFTLRPDADLSGDQSADDQLSDFWETTILTEDITVLGRAELNVKISCDQPNANLCVRLVDVQPDGKAYRVSMGMLNLSQRESDESPEAMPLDKPVTIKLLLDECGYCFKAGHRIRLTIGTSYWPMVLPTAYDSSLVLYAWSKNSVSLPLLGKHDRVEVAEPKVENMLPEYIVHKESEARRWTEHDLQTGFTRYHVHDDTGLIEHPELGWKSQEIRQEEYRIKYDDPLSAVCTGKHCSMRQYENTRMEVVATTELLCEADQFVMHWSLRISENEQELLIRSGEDRVPRMWL